MKLSRLLTANAVLWIAFGIAFTVYGPVMVAFFGVPELPEENVLLYWNVVSFARMFGAAIFGLGLLLWSLRGMAGQSQLSAEARRGILFALLLANAVGLFVAIVQQFSVWQGAAGLVAAVIFGLFCLGYVYFLQQ